MVFGAGAFGGWTAIELVRRGASVTLIDAWGPGHSRASSGGETRVIRATYGSHTIYTRMAAGALSLWRRHEDRTGRRFFRRTGALWMLPPDNHFARASANTLRSLDIPIEELTQAEGRRRFPQIDLEGV
ncbi:MAG TPA: FAD-dependent oxidoreductase, partial [Vicinamibacterales bacterium]|nr:FAD-dependent oxidoreductase [Vicinamibacterales bacterium]